MNVKIVLCLLIGLSTLRCGVPNTEINDLAEDYVRLVLEIGRYDDIYIDAYFGPEEWIPDPIPETSAVEFPSGELISVRRNGYRIRYLKLALWNSLPGIYLFRQNHCSIEFAISIQRD
jgi:hypothetical protein